MARVAALRKVTNEATMKRVPAKEVEAHIDATNPFRGQARDAWYAMPIGWEKLSWSFGVVDLDDIPEVTPASKRDVKRYASHAKKRKEGFPAVVLIEHSSGLEVVDGAHRIAAARQLEHEGVAAYVGVRR